MPNKIRIPDRLFGVIGDPIAHSLSPLLHNWGYAEHGLDHAYMAFRVAADSLADFMTGFRALPLGGLSVTIPHKEAVMAFVDRLTDAAREAGAVNTVFWEDGLVVGDNTDAAGFLDPLPSGIESALVLGAGGAAAGVVYGLKSRGVGRIVVSARTHAKAEALAGRFGCSVVDWTERGEAGTDLVVNATPLGMAGERVGASPFPADAFTPTMLAYDLVYNPLRTHFLVEAEAAGARTLDGLAMFIGQAALQFSRFTGREFDRTGARTLLLEALAKRG